jgi:hypothetical protein
MFRYGFVTNIIEASKKNNKKKQRKRTFSNAGKYRFEFTRNWKTSLLSWDCPFTLFIWLGEDHHGNQLSVSEKAGLLFLEHFSLVKQIQETDPQRFELSEYTLLKKFKDKQIIFLT